MSHIRCWFIVTCAVGAAVLGQFGHGGGVRCQASAVGGQETLQIGAWNIKLLGDPDDKSPQEAKDLAEYIKFAKVDILALEEIWPTGPSPAGYPAQYMTSKILDQTFAKLNENNSANWKHILFPDFPSKKKDDRKQWVGIAWNEDKVQPEGNPLRLKVSNDFFPPGSNENRLFKRNLHGMKFKSGEGKTDFVLLPVHLKSNVDGNFRPHREAEAKELVKHLGEISQKWPGEKDIVILGDFNFLVDKGMAVEKAREILVEAMFRDLNANNEGTHIGSGKAPFDRFFVPIQPEFDQSKQRVVREFLKLKNLKDETFTAKYSDHLMIVTEMRVMNDDD